MMSMIAHVEAGFPVKSEVRPAMMPPMIPPTSKRVDRLAAVAADTWPSSPKSKKALISKNPFYHKLSLNCD